MERMMKKWSASAHAFFHPTPAIEYCHCHKCHVFSCAAKGCNQSIAHYLDTTDKESTGNMHKHICSCWGSNVLDMADNIENLENARKIVKAHHNNGTITSMFQCLKGKDCMLGFQKPAPVQSHEGPWLQLLDEDGLANVLSPHPTTVSRDVKTVFAKTRQCIAKLLQEYDGELNFATDAWTSPNHQAFIVFTLHFIHDGQPV
ncbi:hypothetical protein ARMGADRAFT_1048098 [Armillaria gallica]|uniref:Uncharacterized protein n=1 Tax=Armillaria gallica TaxID=47427 RepID=A0A2H3CQB2_ARMGA|nr:hypothetical protein ARMGADRAFT_1048098 [Armillaria gallica]